MSSRNVSRMENVDLHDRPIVGLKTKIDSHHGKLDKLDMADKSDESDPEEPFVGVLPLNHHR